jgi:hypothetical protein
MALASSCFSPVVDVDGRPKRSASITLVLPFLNISIHSYILWRGKALSPYWAHKLVLISAPLTPAHKNCTASTLREGTSYSQPEYRV